MKKEMICIVCPRGCRMTVEVGQQVSVSANGCPRGAQYAENECLRPMRTVTTTVPVANRENTVVSVKTQTPVAKGDMAQVVKTLRSLTVNAPVKVGQVICEDVCGSRICITKTVL